MSGLSIAFNVEPHPPATLMAACVHDANTAYQEAHERACNDIRKIAEFVSAAEQYAQKAGVSFRSLFAEGGQHAVHPVFVFSRQKATMLLAIARNPALMSDQHAAQLPGDYSTLAKLAQLPAAKLTKLIADGKVTATTRRAEVAALIAKPAAKVTRKAPDVGLLEMRPEFQAAVAAEVEKRLPDHARLEIERFKSIAKNQEFLQGVWRGRVQACKDLIDFFDGNWRTLAASLHPDRAPADRREQFTEASSVLNRLKAKVDKVEREDWGK